MNKTELFSKLPSVDEVMESEEIRYLLKEFPRKLVVEFAREAISNKRKEILKLNDSSKEPYIDIKNIIEYTINKTKLEYSLSLKNVINATGTVIHTNLGRSLLSEDIKDEVWNLSSRYSNLEYNLEKGERGSRYSHIINIIKRLTNAEDVLIVNNNAAAVLLVLNTLSKDGEAIVSRGELVEVGGSFRIPSIMELSGSKLVEVGSTNKTHLFDYEDYINENTKVLMKVHTSNYKIMGFTESVSIEKLSKLGKKYNIPVVEDLGSGVLIDLSKYGLSYEPTVLDSIEKGIDIVTFSGDKLLGGPQAGIIVGKKKYIDKMKKNQLTRALRVDKLTISALEATLRMYLDEEKAIKLFNKISSLNLDINIKIEDGLSQVGGGSMPTEVMKTKVISIVPNNISVSNLERKMRLSKSHIIGKIYDNKYILDIRTIFEDEFDIIVNEINNIVNK